MVKYDSGPYFIKKAGKDMYLEIMPESSEVILGAKQPKDLNSQKWLIINDRDGSERLLHFQSLRTFNDNGTNIDAVNDLCSDQTSHHVRLKDHGHNKIQIFNSTDDVLGLIEKSPHLSFKQPRTPITWELIQVKFIEM